MGKIITNNKMTTNCSNSQSAPPKITIITTLTTIKMTKITITTSTITKMTKITITTSTITKTKIKSNIKIPTKH